MTVSSKVANIRSGPVIQYDILWKVEKYHPLIIIETKGDWNRFRDFEKDEGWIHKSLLDKTKSIIAIKDNCNVRSAPGTNNKVLFTIERGIPFKILKRKGKWIHVQHADGDKGWLHNSLVW